MKSLNFTNSPVRIENLAAVEAMKADWFAKNGEPRRFSQGFSGDWFNLKHIMLGLGYEISIDRRMYIVRPVGAKGRIKKLTREAALKRIDEILIANGREPFIRRNAA